METWFKRSQSTDRITVRQKIFLNNVDKKFVIVDYQEEYTLKCIPDVMFFRFDLLSFCQTEIKPRPAMTAAEYQKLHNAYRECLNPFSMAITDAFVFLGFKEHQEVFFFSLIMIKIMLHMQRADCNGIIIHVQPNFLYLRKCWWLYDENQSTESAVMNMKCLCCCFMHVSGIILQKSLWSQSFYLIFG